MRLTNVLFALWIALCATTLEAAQRVAITFDDLPLNGVLPVGVTEVDIAERVLAILKERKVPQAYGFMNAAKLVDRPNGKRALELWRRAGHPLGNHAYSHTDLHRVTGPEFLADVLRNEPVLMELSRESDWRWFRYPYLREGNELDKRREVRKALLDRKYRIAQVTLDYEDYLWNSVYARCVDRKDQATINRLRESYLHTASEYIASNRRMAKMLFDRDIDHVLLLHLGAFSAEILPDLFDLLAKQDLRLATLEEVQTDPVYRIDPDAASRYGGTLLEQLMDVRKLEYPEIAPKPRKELEEMCR
jgi:peptidoglycan/xylan/chitin deacetylase (PgdA/CDA1 family)